MKKSGSVEVRNEEGGSEEGKKKKPESDKAQRYRD